MHPSSQRIWNVGPGRRIYAIGDIHGRADLFGRMLKLIRDDAEKRGVCPTTVVILGDFIDRGPASASLAERLLRYQQASERFVVLRGNHEDLMAKALLQGDLACLRGWLNIGGDAAMASWGVARALIAEGATADLLGALRKAVPEAVVSWLGRLPLTYRSGDVLFVHAGIRPNVPIAEQHPHDLLWIRDEFRMVEKFHDVLVVHGHSVSERAEDLPNRIGLDTGAYWTGRLTALGLEGSEHWLLVT